MCHKMAYYTMNSSISTTEVVFNNYNVVISINYPHVPGGFPYYNFAVIIVTDILVHTCTYRIHLQQIRTIL